MELKINYYVNIIALILLGNISANGSRFDRSRIYDLRLNAPDLHYKIAYDQLNKRYLVIKRDSLNFLNKGSIGWKKKTYDLNQFDANVDFRQLVVLSSKTRLFLVLRSGGYVYEMVHDSIKKLDKCSNFHSQFGSAKFIMNDTIISYGGYGFWKFEPFFTFFDLKTGEWEMWDIKSEDHLPSGRSNFVSYYDQRSNYFYMIGGFTSKYKAQKPIERIPLDDVWRINMSSRKWEQLGNIRQNSEGLYDLPVYAGFNTPSYKERELCWDEGKRFISLLDFPNNKATNYRLPEETIYNFSTKHQPAINEEDDEIIYATQAEDPEIRILPIHSILSCKQSNFKIYTNYLAEVFEGLVLFCILIAGFFISRRYKKISLEGHKIDFHIAQNVLKYRNTVIDLDQTELKIMLELCSDLNYHNIVDLLGSIEPENKSMDSIYKQRRRIFDSLNNKAHLATKGVEIILTRKSPSDKRMIEVKINEEIVQIHP